MKTVSELSLEQAPPLWIPLRFFLTAPLFGIAAGGLLLVMGDGAFASRWIPGVMALTHLITLGFITMVICGAVLQVLPVLGGVPVPGVTTVGPAVHWLLTTGILALVTGFLGGYSLAFDLAVIALGGGILLFVGAVALGLWRVRVLNPTVKALRGALFGLSLALLVGSYLVKLLSGYGASPHMEQFIELHLGWALLGWVGLLTLGVGFQVVPLFQMTREFPPSLVRWGPGGILSALVIWSLSLIIDTSGWRLLAEAAMAAGFAAYAAITLWLQRVRRRRVADAGVLHWRTSAIALLLAVALWVGGLVPASDTWSGYPMLWGTVVIGGVVVTLINGMLYKIVPFLAWFHLQRRQMALSSQARVPIPHMQQLLPAGAVAWQFRLHLLVLGLAAAALAYPQQLSRWLGVSMLCSFGLLGWNLFQAARLYRKTDRLFPASGGVEH